MIDSLCPQKRNVAKIQPIVDVYKRQVMKLWEHPRLTGALCAAAVLACAAMPAAFLAVTDAAYIGRVVPVAEPYTAPTPAADDYYIPVSYTHLQNIRIADDARHRGLQLMGERPDKILPPLDIGLQVGDLLLHLSLIHI